MVGLEDGLGVECLSGSGAIASAFSKAFKEGLTITLVSGRSVLACFFLKLPFLDSNMHSPASKCLIFILMGSQDCLQSSFVCSGYI